MSGKPAKKPTQKRPKLLKLPPYVSADEIVYDSFGRVIDDAYIERAVADVERAVAEADRLRGRPSLSGASGKSPQTVTRLTPEQLEAVIRIADERGTSVSSVIRDAIDGYIDRVEIPPAS